MDRIKRKGGKKGMIKIEKRIITVVGLAIFVGCVIGLAIACNQNIPINDVNKNDSFIEIERATETGLSQSYSPDIGVICENEEFSIERLTPNLFRIIGLETDTHYMGDSRVYSTVGYGDAFAQALQVLTRDYEIKSITPIVYHHFKGSFTKELIIVVDNS